MAIPDELLKLMQGPQFGQPQAPAAFPAAPVAPQVAPPATQLTPELRARVEGSRASSEQPIEFNIFKGAGGAALGGLGRATGATALGESMGEYYGAQKYGTGIAADGSLTGQPRTPNTLAGQGLTLAATGLEYLGDATTGAKTTAGGIATGLGHVGEYLTGTDLVEGGVVKTPTAPTQQAAPEPSVFQHTNAPLPSASIGQVSAPSPFEQPPTQNPMLTPQIEQEYAPQRPDVIAGTPFSSVPAPSLAQQLPESGTEQFLDPQGRLRRRDIGTGELTEQYSEYEKQAAAREQRAADQFGVARGPDARDREAGEMSTADARDLDKLKDPRATESERARAMQVAERLGRDPMTGAPIKTGQEGLTFDQVMKMKEFDFKRDQEAYKRSQDTLIAEGKAEEAFAQDTEALQIIESDANRIGNLVNEAVGLTTETGTTGLAGAIIKHIPGTDANQLKEVLNVVTSKVAIDRLTQIKKTGATLGQISNTELEMLQKSFDTLQQGLTGERLRKALVNYGTALKKVEDKIRSQYNAKHKDRIGDQAPTQASSSMQSGETTPSGRKVKIY